MALETSESSQKNHMLSDLDFIKKTFECSYAPAEWKRDLFSWDLQSKLQPVVEEVKRNKKNDIKQFQKSLTKFFKSTRDYHVSISFTSTEYASLPFDIRYRNGKYIITKIEKEENLPVEVGDEVLAMDGVPFETVVAELQRELGEENKATTDHALALEILTRRNGKLGHPVPQGPIALKVKTRHSDKVISCQVTWNYKPERIVLNPFVNAFKETIKENPSKMRLLLEERLSERSTIPYYEEMTEVFSDDGLPSDLLGSSKSVFSTLGKEHINELRERPAAEEISWIWNWLWRKKLPEETKKFFDAQLIELPSGKKAGYMRISTYQESNPEKALKAFISGIKYFQHEADMLLIDQTNNPGGSVLYMYALASVLTDRPLVTLKERKLLTQSHILKSIEIIDAFKDADPDLFGDEAVLGFSLNEFYQNLVKEAHYNLSQWELGHLLTDPYPFIGMETINPHPKVNFTKPLFILVNEMSFSCGDEFPALFQDNKRATIIGTPTAGAGGSINSLNFTNLNGINLLKYTSSIVHRLDGACLENLGVTPDIFFDFKYELYDKDTANADFHKIYDILDTYGQK